MKIAAFSSTDLGTMGGLEVMMRSIYPAYHKLGIDCDFFLPFSNRRLKEKLDFPVKLMPPAAMSMGLKSNLYRRFIFNQYLKYMVCGKYDLIHIHCTYPLGVVMGEFAQKKNVPAVLHCHAVDIQTCEEINYGARMDQGVDQAIKQTILSYDTYIAANNNISGIIQQMGIASDNISIIHNGTHINKYQKSVDRKYIRESLGIKPEEVCFISAGRNHIVKGYDFAIKSFAMLDCSLPFKYLILGRETKKLQPLVDRLGLQGKVILNEDISGEKLIEVMLSADAYILPSMIEGFPLTKAEAFASGLPVITTDCPGCRDCVVDNETGFVVKKRDEKLFSQALKTIALDKVLLKKMQDSAREYAKNLDWENIVKQFMGVYEKLLSRK